MRAHLRAPGLNLWLLNLPEYSQDFSAGEAIWGWTRELAAGNVCFGTKALAHDRVSGFLASLSGKDEEVNRHCRTVLQSRSETPPREYRQDYHPAGNAHPTLALV